MARAGHPERLAAGVDYIRQQLAANPGVSGNTLQKGLQERGLSFGSRQQIQDEIRAIKGAPKKEVTAGAIRGGERSGITRGAKSVAKHFNDGGAVVGAAQRLAGYESETGVNLGAAYVRLLRSSEFRQLPAAMRSQLLSGSPSLEDILMKFRRMKEGQRVCFHYNVENKTFIAILCDDAGEGADIALALEEGEQVTDEAAALFSHFSQSDIAPIHAFFTYLFEVLELG